VDGEDRAGRLPGRLEAARLGPSPEPFQVLDDPAVQDDPLEEDDETTFDEPPPERDSAMPELPTASPRTTPGASFPSPTTVATRTSEASANPRDRDVPGPVPGRR
jgi:hypothetical protein